MKIIKLEKKNKIEIKEVKSFIEAMESNKRFQ